MNIRYLYEAIKLIKFPKGDEHKRYWISEFSQIEIPLPCLEEQNKIADFFALIDARIKNIENLVMYTKQYKQGLLQQMFV